MLYITHPQVQIDPSVPVPKWTLSDAGRDRLVGILDTAWARSLSRIVSSLETKAVDTAVLLQRACGARVECRPGLHENDRSATGFLPPDEFERVADRFFAEPRTSVRGWERAVDAQARIVAAIENVLAPNEPDDGEDADGPIAITGHGGVGTLLLCHLAGMEISRRHDQPPGGGNAFAFASDTRRLVFRWTPIEQVGKALGG